MRYEFKHSFDKSVKAFHEEEKEEIKKIAIQVQESKFRAAGTREKAVSFGSFG